MKNYLKNFMNEFKKFALKGNVVDLAVGIIIGSAFTAIVNSLVKDIIMPPIGAVFSGDAFSDLYINLSGKEFASLADAKAAGAATINYGSFLNTVIIFLITAFAVFLLVKAINRLQELTKVEEAEGPKKAPAPTCPFCLEVINKKATRCPHCTSVIEKK